MCGAREGSNKMSRTKMAPAGHCMGAVPSTPGVVPGTSSSWYSRGQCYYTKGAARGASGVVRGAPRAGLYAGGQLLAPRGKAWQCAGNAWPLGALVPGPGLPDVTWAGNPCVRAHTQLTAQWSVLWLCATCITNDFPVADPSPHQYPNGVPPAEAEEICSFPTW